MNRLILSLSCVLVCAPVMAADPVQPPSSGGADRMQQRRVELRQAISSQRQPVPSETSPRTLTADERAELREQLRRQYPAPREPHERPMHINRP